MAKGGGGARQVRATFFRSDGLARTIAVETGAPTRDAALAMRLFAERIDALRAPIDPGFGFDMIRLAVPRPQPHGASQFRLRSEGRPVGQEWCSTGRFRCAPYH